MTGGRRRYRIHGLTVSSPMDLPLPVAGGDHVDVTFRTGPPDRRDVERTHSLADDPDDTWAIEHWLANGRLEVEFPGIATFDISRDDVVLHSRSSECDEIAHLLLDHVIPRVVALRGDLMLHAAGVVGPSGCAHLFLGTSGAGKSTLSAALAADGWLLLDDDGVRVVRSGTELCAVPGYPGVRLLPDSAKKILPGWQGQAMSSGHPKHRFTADAMRMADHPARIGALYLLELTKGPTSSEPVKLPDAIVALIHHGFHVAESPDQVRPRAFALAGELATGVPMKRLRRRRGLGQLKPTLELLGELDAEL